ncbi:hypothetical protein STENM36S_05101 [Streptomyces tendae]
MKPEAVTTEYRGHARDVRRQAAQSDAVDLAVARGGDGTVNAVVNGTARGTAETPTTCPASRRSPKPCSSNVFAQRPRSGPMDSGGGDLCVEECRSVRCAGR